MIYSIYLIVIKSTSFIRHRKVNNNNTNKNLMYYYLKFIFFDQEQFSNCGNHIKIEYYNIINIFYVCSFTILQVNTKNIDF